MFSGKHIRLPQPALYQLYGLYILFLVAVMASHCAHLLVHYAEICLHRLIVCDTLWVVAVYYATQHVRCFHLLLLHHLIVTYNAEHHVRGNHRQT